MSYLAYYQAKGAPLDENLNLTKEDCATRSELITIPENIVVVLKNFRE